MGILNEQDYYKIVYGGWLGKNIGGTLGAPVEGRKELLDLTYYPILPNGPLENDDLDLQLVNLHALEQYGPQLNARHIAQEWLEHVFFPFDEYGYALANLRRGLLPPVAGSFQNPFADCMGSPIRSEIWAMIAPGAPAVAARYAYEDAIVDHAGGEGVYGEMFFAAIESAVFIEKDRDRLIAIGLRFIPEDCRTARAVQDLLLWHREDRSWTEARELILEDHGRDNFTDAPQNVAFTILGWLYGNSFEDAILKAANCGYDTDCTAATLGAILGMLLGPEALPEQWVRPLGDGIVVSAPIKGFPVPANLDELTRRTMRVGKQVHALWETGISISPYLKTQIDDSKVEPGADIRSLWGRQVTQNRWLLPEDSMESQGLELILDYGAGGPSIGESNEKTLIFTLINRSAGAWEGRFSLALPEGWEGGDEEAFILAEGQSQIFTSHIRSAGDAASTYSLFVKLARYHDHTIWNELTIPFCLIKASSWTIIGPDGFERQAEFAGNTLEWHEVYETMEDGLYRVRSNVWVPSDRTLRLIVAANSPVIVRWNGEIVIESEGNEEWMPAFHRAPESQLFERYVCAGVHELEIETIRNGRPLETRVLPVAGGKTSVPGPYYYFTDVLFVKG